MFDNHGFTRNKNGDVIFYKSIICGVTSGACGAYLGSPIYLVKTHLQSKSDAHIAVGHQHKHSSMSSGFKAIYGQYGIRGLWRGSVASMTRVSVGGSIQLTSFATITSFARKHKVCFVAFFELFASSYFALVYRSGSMVWNIVLFILGQLSSGIDDDAI